MLNNTKTQSLPQDQDQDQDSGSQDQEQDQDFIFCPRGASRPRLWSRGLHHWFHIIKDERLATKMEGKTDFSRYLKQFDGVTGLTLAPYFTTDLCHWRPISDNDSLKLTHCPWPVSSGNKSRYDSVQKSICVQYNSSGLNHKRADRTKNVLTVTANNFLSGANYISTDPAMC